MEEDDRINEVYIKKNGLSPMFKNYNICKSTIQIIVNEKYGSGFFIKFKRINKFFFWINNKWAYNFTWGYRTKS